MVLLDLLFTCLLGHCFVLGTLTGASTTIFSPRVLLQLRYVEADTSQVDDAQCYEKMMDQPKSFAVCSAAPLRRVWTTWPRRTLSDANLAYKVEIPGFHLTVTLTRFGYDAMWGIRFIPTTQRFCYTFLVQNSGCRYSMKTVLQIA